MNEIVERLNAALTERYVIERELGRGGMATVYLAQDTRHDRPVALKVLRPELAAIVGADRFLAEIRTTANLQHPHILPLFDSGEADGQLFYVMPYVEGESLRERLEREGQLPVDEAVRIVSEVAEALQEAHDKGIVHRDVKPANILLRKGKPLVADFGIALALSAAGGGRLTETGLSLGTPYYMSPEQASGDQRVTAATDTYSLGCMLYEMLTGDPPFPGSTAQAVLAKILTGDPPGVTEQRRAVPSNVDAAVRKAIEKVPADRFVSVRDFARALADPGFRHGAPAQAPREATTWKRATAGLGVLAASLVVALVWTLAGGKAAQPRFSWIAPPAPLDSIAFHLAPDGDRILYRIRRDPAETWLYDFAREAPTRLEDGSDRMSFSPDGGRLAVSDEDGLRILDLTGRASQTILDTLRVSTEILWGDDGFLYYGTQNARLARVPIDGGAIDTLTAQSSALQVPVHLHALPAGRGLLYEFIYPGAMGGSSTIEVLDLETRQARPLVDAVAAVYARSGHLVFVKTDGTVWAAPFDLDALEMTGPSVQVLSGVWVGPNDNVNFNLSATGTLLYTAGSVEPNAGRRVVWRDRSGAILPDGPGLPSGRDYSFGSFRLSPDDSKLAVTIDVDDESRLHVKDLNGGADVVLADSASATAWLDAETLLYSSETDDEHRKIFVRPADGSRPAERFLAQDGKDLFSASRSSDGEWTVYAVGDSNGLRILGHRRGEDTAVVLLDYNEAAREPALSPDKRWLAYASGDFMNREVFVRPFPNVSARKIAVSLEGGFQPRWSQSDDELFYMSRGAGSRIWSARFSTASGFDVLDRTPLFSYYQDIIRVFRDQSEYDVSADGQRFILVEYPEADRGPRRLHLIENFFALIETRLAAVN